MCGLYGVTFELLSYAGECVTGDCGGGCQLQGTCSAYLSFVSCNGNTIRWENNSLNMWVELNTITKDWSWDWGDLFNETDCFGDVDQDVPICACFMSNNCDIEDPDFIDYETCSSFRRETQCNLYTPDGICGYATTIRITVDGGGGGGGSGECA